MQIAQRYAGPELVSPSDLVGLSIAALRVAVDNGALDRERQVRSKLFLIAFDQAIAEGKDRATAIALGSAESGLPVNQ